MKIKSTLNKIQFVNWLVVCFLIVYSIFITGKPYWIWALKIGLVIQLVLLLINWKFGVRSNAWWAAYNIGLLLLIGFVDLLNYGFIRIGIFHGDAGFVMAYLFIFIVNLGFFFSILQINKEFRTIKK